MLLDLKSKMRSAMGGGVAERIYYVCLFEKWRQQDTGLCERTFLASAMKIMWEEQLVDPPIAYAIILSIILTNK